MKDKKWVRLLAYVTGTVNQELLLQNEYLAAENLILRGKLPSRLRLSDPERATLAEIGKRLGRQALRKVACIAKPDTILAWYRRLIARKFDGSQHRSVVLANRAAGPSGVTCNGLRTLRFGAFGSGGSTGGRSRAVLQRVGNGPAHDHRFVDTRPERWIIRIARFTPLAVRNDDAARPAPESRRSGPTPAAGSAVALDCLFPLPSASDSDDSIPEILAGAGTGFAR